MSNLHPETHDFVNIAVMGMTGTGKSSLIKLLTNDDKVLVGHDPESETSDVQTAYYVDRGSKRTIMMIDTPGFDDSRYGDTDTQILRKISVFMASHKVGKLNGLIYMHRITDPRVGGLSRNNIRMFKALCGDENLRNVRIVTTNWDRLKEPEGAKREYDLEQGPFAHLIEASAQMRRHDNTAESAQKIISELIPLQEITTQFQDQIASGVPLGETDAGRVVDVHLEEMKKKHAEALVELEEKYAEARAKQEEELASMRAQNAALAAELEKQRELLQEIMKQAQEDRETLKKNVEELRQEGERRKAEEEQRKGGGSLARFGRAIRKLVS